MIAALELLAPERLVALVVLPLLVWLATPPRPRRRHVTAHVEQWRAALDRVGRRAAGIRWLRLLLLVLAFAAVVLAWCGPVSGRRGGPERLVVLLDGSASMAAPRGGPAWDVAGRRVLAALGSLAAEARVDLVVGGGRARRAGGTPAEVAAALAEFAPAVSADDAGLRLGELATELATDPRVGVWVVTDGRDAGELPGGDEDAIAVTLVGERDSSLANCGIGAVEWELTNADRELAVTVSVVGPAGAAVDVVARTLDGVERHRVPVSIPADAADPIDVRLVVGLADLDGRVEVVLESSVADDALAVDDAVRLSVPRLPRPDVAVLGPGPEDAPEVHALAAALAAEHAGRVVGGEDGDRVGVVLVEGGGLAAIPARGICFGVAWGEAGAAAAVIEDVGAIDWDRFEPLLDGVDLSDLVVRRALVPAALPPGGDVLVRGETGPLVVRFVDDRGAACLWTAFRLTDSNLGRLVALPQLVSRVLQRGRAATAVRIVGPALLDPAESDLAPTRIQPPGRGSASGPPVLAAAGTALTVPLLLLAVGLLALRAHVR